MHILLTDLYLYHYHIIQFETKPDKNKGKKQTNRQQLFFYTLWEKPQDHCPWGLMRFAVTMRTTNILVCESYEKYITVWWL